MSEPGAGAIARRWERLAGEGRTALIPFVAAGYPSRAATVETLQMLAADGADLVEVGVPFSDPLADGPTIQRASFEALRQGTTVHGVLAMVREAGLSIPVVLFTYLNPILRYGAESFLAEARAAGASGVLVTDLPVGADPTLETTIAASGLDRIPLIAPTTTDRRIEEAVAGGSGFAYLISRLGVTGARTAIGGEIERLVARVRARTRLPLAVGFGIAGAAQAVAVARFADGIVVGSALVERMGQGANAARELIVELRQALDAAGVPG